MTRFWQVARAVAWRSIHKIATTPTLLIPSVVFPMFFFVAFAGGLSNVGNVPGFDAEFPSGYTAFQFVFVLIQASAFGGVFTGFGIASDFENGFARRLLLAAPNRYGIIAGYAIAARGADDVRGGADLRRRAAHGDAGGRRRRRHRGARAARATWSRSRRRCSRPAWRCGCARCRPAR